MSINYDEFENDLAKVEFNYIPKYDCTLIKICVKGVSVDENLDNFLIYMDTLLP